MRIRAIVTAVCMALSILTPQASACSCSPTPPPCQAYSSAKAVFLGTVTDVLNERNGRIELARVRIDKAYKGITETSVELLDYGICDGPTLRLGEQYLWYTWSYSERPNRFQSDGCTRSRHVQQAAEDLDFLNGLSNSAPTGAVLGKVLVRTYGFHEIDKPAPGAMVTLSGPSGVFTTTTAQDGQYSFPNLEPGKYVIRAEMAGHRPIREFDNYEWLRGPVIARGCQIADVILWRTWAGRVTGRLVRANGAPAGAKIQVDLLRREEMDGQVRNVGSGRVLTDDSGRYTFEQVAPGRYQIVMNKDSFPTPRSPYPTVYWPSARKEGEGLFIEVGDKPSEAEYDFLLPPEPAGEAVEGLVLADGKPAVGVTVVISAGNRSRGLDDENRLRTDANGRFRFQAFEGFNYRLYAFVTKSLGKLGSSAELTISVPTNGQSIVLVLDPVGRD